MLLLIELNTSFRQVLPANCMRIHCPQAAFSANTSTHAMVGRLYSQRRHS